MASRAKLTLSERAQAEMRRPYERLSGSSRCASSVIVLKALKASSKRIVLPYLKGGRGNAVPVRSAFLHPVEMSAYFVPGVGLHT